MNKVFLVHGKREEEQHQKHRLETSTAWKRILSKRRHEKSRDEKKNIIRDPKALVFCEPQTVTAQNTTKQHFNSIFKAFASTYVHPKEKKREKNHS